MGTITEYEIFIFIAQLGIIIFIARVVGEFAKRLKQPIIVGELITGIILGPSIVGRFFPDFYQTLFPETGPNAYLLHGFAWLCVIFLLLMTGLEIDLTAAMRHGKQNLLTSLFGVILPFSFIVGLSAFLPQSFFPLDQNRVHISLLLATALSVVAIPVIATILFDLKILRSNVGLNIITSGVLSDMLGWSILAVIVALNSQGFVSVLSVVKPVAIIAMYFAVALTAGRWITDRILDLVDLKLKESAAMMAFLFAFALINGAIAHLLGIHVIFGAFVAGLMAGESKRITPHMRQATQDFIFSLFAPVFFVLVGMQLTFRNDFSWLFIFILLAVSSIGKISGAYLGALASGLGRKNALTIGVGINTQGPMGVIVALIGRELGLFNEEVFFTIVVISVATS